jgi:hypothetical protein
VQVKKRFFNQKSSFEKYANKYRLAKLLKYAASFEIGEFRNVSIKITSLFQRAQKVIIIYLY